MCRGNRKGDVTTMVTYSHATTPLGQSERAYYLSYFIKTDSGVRLLRISLYRSPLKDIIHRTSFVLDENNKKATIITTERDKVQGQLSEHTV